MNVALALRRREADDAGMHLYGPSRRVIVEAIAVAPVPPVEPKAAPEPLLGRLEAVGGAEPSLRR